jgi:hypothetical protein
MKKVKFKYELLSPDTPGFIEVSGQRHRFTNDDQMAEHLVKLYMDTAETFKRPTDLR